jgi:hypothetical protein
LNRKTVCRKTRSNAQGENVQESESAIERDENLRRLKFMKTPTKAKIGTRYDEFVAGGSLGWF